LDIIFDLCYYAHQDFRSVLEMHVFDIDWMYEKLVKTIKTELKVAKEVTEVK